MTLMQDDWNRIVNLIESASESRDGNDLLSLKMELSTDCPAGSLKNTTTIVITAEVVSQKV